jgi:SPP1 gp7 family putative phage head morphogenesis protein
MLRQRLESAVPVDREALASVCSEYRLRTANLAGQWALEAILTSARRWLRNPREAAVQVAPRTLRERLIAGEEWQQVTEGWVFNLRDPALLRQLEVRGTQITGEVTSTMLADLRAVLEREVYRGGQAPAHIAEELETIFPATYRNRGLTIARTEIGAAQGLVTHETYERNGVGQKQWMALLDGKTRPAHAEAHGQVRALDEVFTVGGEAMMHPGDPAASPENTVNCRCDELPVIDDSTALPAQPWVGAEEAHNV